MSILLASSTEVNQSSSPIRLTRGASDWDWAVFAVMALADLGVIFWMHRRLRGHRLLHQLPIVILTTSTIAYYAMASNLGRTGIASQFGRHLVRDIFWVRYIQWFINAPLLLLMLLIASGTRSSEYILPVFLAWVAVVCGLVGALTSTRYKWGFFAIGTAALLYLVWRLLTHTRSAASGRPYGHTAQGTNGSTATAGPTGTGAFNNGAGSTANVRHSNQFAPAAYLSTLFLIYPIAWGLCEGSSKLGISGEMIWYGVLDILAGPVFIYWVLSKFKGEQYSPLGEKHGRGVSTTTGTTDNTTGGMGAHSAV